MQFKKGEIEGVNIHQFMKYSDDRGFIIEAIRADHFLNRFSLVMSYVSFTKPGITRGPHEHILQKDIFCFIGPGNFKIKLWDNRKNSKTFRNCMEINGGEKILIRIIVPPGVVHGYRNISKEKNGMVINYPDKLYRGWGKKEKVDEIRHEDKEDEFYLDFISNDK
jgi:dTDP-4-dehydrorhamnose 3,5-epimerase